MLLLTLALAACGGSSDYAMSPSASASPGDYAMAESSGGESYNYRAETASVDSEESAPPSEPMMAPMAQVASAGSGDSGGQAQYAQNTPPPPPQPQAGQTTTTPPRAAADDAARGPLLIYQATLHLSVFEVEATQRTVITIAQELNGFLALQNDQQVVIRVPAAKFREALARIEQAGDVLHRNIEALDVSEEFRDVQIRLRNAEVVRDRLAALMAQARTVEEALAVQTELERITGVIEQLKGRMAYLGDRIAFSTITVYFQPAPTATTDQPDVFRLPFPWLDELSLRSLLNLPYQD
jgi:hypothetical protein